MRFYLNFKSDNYGKKEIDEPFGTNDIDFNLKQKSNGMGRDISFSGGDIVFEFGLYRNHELAQILYYNRKFGFESEVVLTIEIDENNKYDCDLDFATAETDDLTYFKCKGIEDSKLQIINARKSVKVDVFSNKSIDGDFIEPLVAENIFLNSKPVVQNSQWQQTVALDRKFEATGSTTNSTKYYHINTSQDLVKSEIEDTYTFFEQYKQVSSTPTESDYKLFTAKNNTKNVNIKISDLLIHFDTDVDNGGDGYVDFQLQVRNGLNFETATVQKLIDITKTENQTYDFSGGFNIMIPEVARGESVWLFFYMKIRQSANVPLVTERFEVFMEISGMKVDINLESTGFSSIASSLKLYDVMSQVIKSISGLQINSNRFINYPDRLVNGNLLRGITDKPFYVSLEDLEKSLTEFKGDYEIGSDGKIFFGIEEDFYTGNECGFFPNIQFSEMNKTYNPKHTVNEFHFMYKKFQSQKENEQINSADTIHGEAKYSFFAKKVENKKVVEIEWIRDAFLLEEARRKAIEITTNTSYQNDDDLFIIDSIATTADKSISDVYEFNHVYNTDLNKLILRSDGTVNFISLGIVVGSNFTIKSPDLNAADYTVFAVNASELQLTRVSAGVNSSGADGIRQTKFIYFIDMDFIPYTNYTNQDFTSILNLNSGDNYSNLRRSVRRNINQYWNSYLASCNLYWKDKPLQNNWYKNNPLCETTYNGNTVIEGAQINPNNPILTPVLYNDIVFANVDFADFVTLQNNIRSQRGFIRTIDNNKRVIKVYPIDIKYSLSDRNLNVKGEEKFEPSSMTISTEFNFILINNETRVYEVIAEIKQNKLYIYDANRQLLYNPVYWMEVSINGAFASSIEELKEWLSLLN